MASIRIRVPHQAPPSFTATPVSIVDDVRHLIDECRNVQNQVVAEIQPVGANFENAVLPLIHTENIMTSRGQILGFYRFVSPNAELRNASNEA